MPDISKLTLLSEVLGIGIEEILGGDKEKVLSSPSSANMLRRFSRKRA